MTYVIAQPCVDLVKDKACIEECPVDCIYEGDRMLYIHPDECVDCGACEPVCPVEAIFYEDDVPERVEGLHGRQRRVLRRPGIARRCGQARPDPQDFDAPLLASVPPQEHEH
jgi:NAD-dependent dihydropyrimidine dehydrogenase PreA subunit